MILQGKTVLVTGVGGGLGRECAASALRDGANVVIAARTAAVPMGHPLSQDVSRRTPDL